MRYARGAIGFYTAVLACNAMTWGMFNVLNMPRSISAGDQPAVTADVRTKSVAPKPIVGVPTRVKVPDVNIDVKVSEGNFDPATKEWSISDDSAYFATASVPANNSNGTTLLYGHARGNMFAPLTGVTPNSTVEIYTDSSTVFVYRFASMREVIPTDTSVFTEEGSPKLVMQTCSGPWDAYRTLYTFDLVETRTA